MDATRAPSRSLSPKRISAVATVSFSLITGTAPKSSNVPKSGAGIEITVALFGIAQGQKNLRRNNAGGGKNIGIGLRQLDLPHRGGGLALLQAAAHPASRPRPCPRRPSAMAPDDTRITRFCRRASSATTSGLPQGFQPGAAQFTAGRVHQQGREPTLTTTSLALAKPIRSSPARNPVAAWRCSLATLPLSLALSPASPSLSGPLKSIGGW